MSSIIYMENKVDGILTTASAVTLCSTDSSYGIQRQNDDMVVVSANTPATEVSTGRYEYDISSLSVRASYDYTFKVHNSDGYGGSTVSYVSGVIPRVDYSNSNERGTWVGNYGFDGSMDLPSTGGDRTDRDEYGGGDGFWDGIQYESLCVEPITQKGMCFKDRCAAMLRAALKDTDPQCWAFTEDEIDMYLEIGLSNFNQTPMFTGYTWGTLESRWLSLIVLGGQISALYAQGLIEAGREFTITDNGISFNPPQLSGYMQTIASQLIGFYTTQLQAVKGNMKPSPEGVGTFRVLAIHPAFMRIRHLREKAIY